MNPTRLTRRSLLQHTGGALSGVAVLGGLGPLAGRLARAGTPGPEGPTLARIRPSALGPRARAVLASLDDTHRSFADGSRELLLWPGDADRLADVGIPVSVSRPVGRDASDSRLAVQPGERDDYRRLPDYAEDLAALAAANPDIARLHILPTTSLLGREIVALEIASDVGSGRRDGRPVVHMDGMHHCREWPAGEMPTMWAFDLCEGYGIDAALTRIVDGARTFVLPVVNPDGFYRSRESLGQTDSGDGVAGSIGALALGASGREAYWRKNMRGYTDVNVGVAAGPVAYEKIDAHGIDLNRGYPFFWGDDEGSSDVPEDQTYRGTAPYSEPETHNVRDLVLGHLPIAKITHHTSGELMLYPWGRDPFEVRSPDADLMQGLGETMAVSNGYQPKQAFGLYPTSGTSRDWGHGSVRTLAYTFEHGEEFHGPYAATIPAMYAKNRGAFLALYDAVLDPATHLVVTGTGPSGAGRVAVTKDFDTPLADGTTSVAEHAERIVDLAPDGSFELHLPPSTRPHLWETQFGGRTDHSTDPREPAYFESWTLAFDDGTTVEVQGERGEVVELGR